MIIITIIVWLMDTLWRYRIAALSVMIMLVIAAIASMFEAIYERMRPPP